MLARAKAEAEAQSLLTASEAKAAADATRIKATPPALKTRKHSSWSRVFPSQAGETVYRYFVEPKQRTGHLQLLQAMDQSLFRAESTVFNLRIVS